MAGLDVDARARSLLATVLWEVLAMPRPVSFTASRRLVEAALALGDAHPDVCRQVASAAFAVGDHASAAAQGAASIVTERT